MAQQANMHSSISEPERAFFGVWVVRAAFVLAMFGWGIGFYGPPIFLHSVIARTAWRLDLVSLAVTLHFLFGAVVVANLPRMHYRFGIAATKSPIPPPALMRFTYCCGTTKLRLR